MLRQLWQAVSRPRWPNGRHVEYRTDRLAFVLWLIWWPLWAVPLSAIYVGSWAIVVTVTAVEMGIRVAANRRLHAVVERLGADAAGVLSAKTPGWERVYGAMMTRFLHFGARRCDIKAAKLDSRAAAAAGKGDRKAAILLQHRADRERRWAAESRGLIEQMERGVPWNSLQRKIQ